MLTDVSGKAPETLADRVWLAWHSMPRRGDGQPPAFLQIEEETGLARSILSKVTKEKQVSVGQETAKLMADVFRVPVEWILFGSGPGPAPTGPVPDRRVRLGLSSAYPPPSKKRPPTDVDGVPIAKRMAPLTADQLSAAWQSDRASMRADDTRSVDPIPGDARTTDPGRWKALAALDREFGRLATKVTTRAPIDGHAMPLVEAALDLASDDLPRHRGAGLDADDVRFAYDSAWAFLNDLPAPKRKLEEPRATSATAPTRATLEEAEFAFQAALRGAQTTKPPPGKKGKAIVVGPDSTVHSSARSEVRPRAGDQTLHPRQGVKLGAKKGRR